MGDTDAPVKRRRAVRDDPAKSAVDVYEYIDDNDEDMDNADMGSEEAQKSVKRCFNMCPICKMPLCVSNEPSKEHDKKWKLVQAWFKSKPSIIVRDTLRNRTKQVFGVMPNEIIAGKRSTTFNMCHILHRVGGQATVTHNGIWTFGQDVGGGGTKPVSSFSSDARQDPRFMDKLCVEESIFKHVCATDIALPFQFNGAVNMIRLNALVAFISTGTVAGCWDCNMKMTQMEYVPMIFNSCFPTFRPPITPPRSKNVLAIKKNVQLHYLLMQVQFQRGIRFTLSDASMYDAKWEFTMTPALASGWRLKLILTWCMLMIMSSQWNIAKLESMYKHHEIYILNGTSDFYLSLLLYMVYIANYTPSSDPIGFEEFHLFYITNFVFYLKKRGYLGTQRSDSNNLSLAILHKEGMSDTIQWCEVEKMDCSTCSEQRAMADAANTAGQFYTKIVKFINAYYKPFCAQLYSWGTGDGVFEYARFFASPDRIQVLTNTADQANELTIQKFIEIFGSSAHYWFHFKHITMVQIANALKLSWKDTHQIFHPIFNGWYQNASRRVKLLARAPSLVEEHRAERDEDSDISLMFTGQLSLS
jgi:hypothetical protein